jgi:hypothetical protein
MDVFGALVGAVDLRASLPTFSEEALPAERTTDAWSKKARTSHCLPG